MINWFKKKKTPQAEQPTAANAHDPKMVYAVNQPSRFREYKKDILPAKVSGVSSFEILRSAARYHDKNTPVVISILDSLVNNVVGHKGIVLEPNPLNKDGTTNLKAKAIIKKKWDLFLRQCTAQGYTLSQVQRDLVRAWMRDGEVFVQHIDGQYKDRKIPYMIQIVNAELVPNQSTDDGQIAGIKYNADGVPIAYTVENPNKSFLASPTKTISANKMIHIANKKMLAQPRGISVIAGAMTDIQDMDDYEEAEKVKAKMQASLVIAIQKETMGRASLVPGLDKKQPIDREDFRFGAGTVIADLQPGESVTAIQSTAPSPYVVTFAEKIARNIAAGTGASFSTITRNYNGTYSAQRQELLEAWQGYQVLQNDFSCMFLMPVYERFVKNLIDSNILTKDIIAELDEDHIINANYVYPVMPWIDPVKEQTAQKVAIENGTTSRQRVIRENGQDPAEIFAEIEEEKEHTKPVGGNMSSNSKRRG